MFAAVLVVCALLMAARGESPCPDSTTCVFNRDKSTLSCGGRVCATVKAREPTPTGYYLIGPHYKHEEHDVSWFNLYPSAGGRYWDYYTEVPALGCQGYFGLHSGTNSLGCITVHDDCAIIPHLKSAQTHDTTPLYRCFWCFRIGCVITYRKQRDAAYIGDLCVV